MRKLNKKGQVQNLAPAILSLVFAAIVLVFGIVMSQELRDVDTLKNQFTTTNEIDGWLNETAYVLSAESGSLTDRFVITGIIGEQGGEMNVSIPVANATVNVLTGSVTNATTYTNGNVTYNYTYYSGEEAWVGANSTVSGLGTFADFWEIIVLAIVITVVIGLLLVVFGGRKGR